MKKKILIAMLLLAMALGGCGSASAGDTDTAGSDGSEQTSDRSGEESDDTADSEDTVYLSIATSGNWEGILRGKLMDEYCEKLKEWSDGTLQIKVYYNGTLGDDLDLIEGVKEGTLCIINSVPSYQTSVVPEAILLDVPGVFSTVEEYNDFISGDYWDTIQGYYEKQGIRLLSSRAFTFRAVTSVYKISSMEDFQGLRMRTMEEKHQVAFWQSMGCTVTPMNFNGVRLAIQQNILEAQENPLGYMFSSDLAEVQGYVLEDNHLPMISNYLMNEEAYEQLSDEHKELLQRFFDEMETELVENEPAEEETMRATLEKRGYVFTEASDDIKEGIAAGRDVVLNQLRSELGDSVVDDYLNAVEASKNG